MRLMCSISVFVFLVFASFQDAKAQAVIDQMFDPTSLGSIVDGGRFTSGDAGTLGQSFTAGFSGELNQVDLLLSQNNSSIETEMDEITATLFRIDGAGITDGSVLAQRTFIATDLPRFGFEFFPVFENIQIEQAIGDQFAVGLFSSNRSSAHASSAFSNSIDLYQGGTQFRMPNGSVNQFSFTEQGFRTFATPNAVPEPGATMLFSLVGIFGIVKRRRAN